MARIAIIEDDESVASSLRHLLEGEGHRVATTSTPAAGLADAEKGNFDVVVTDLQMPGPNGIDVIKKLHLARPQLPVILMTAHHTTESAIEATKFGAYDYILKPIDPPEFLGLIEKALQSRRLMSEPVAIGETASTTEAIVGKSRVMQNVYKEIGRVAAMPVTVLIRGETGTGKELVARALYQHSDRTDKPFIVVNCAAIPETLLESELFGHEAGAFTDAKTRRIGRFEQANGGTILLDEIGDMIPGTQAKLLRVLQDKTIQRVGGKETIAVDARVIAATHRNLELAIQQKTFREDLYYRLSEAVIHLPPLRDRKEDVPELVHYFLKRNGPELGSPNPTITPEAMAYLQQQNWFGNVRELFNVVRKALLLSRGYPISRDTLLQAIAQASSTRLAADQTLAAYVAELLAVAQRGSLDDAQRLLTDMVEREAYGQAIRLADGDQSKAAKWLGVSRPTIREKLTRYGLHPAANADQKTPVP